MENKFIYGGYILTGGTLDNGKAWQGVNVMLAQVHGDKAPTYATVVKAPRTDSLLSLLRGLAIGQPVQAFFSLPDTNGKVKLVELRPVK